MASQMKQSDSSSPPDFLTPTTMVTVNVRENEQEDIQTFQIHKSYAVYYSTYFMAAFSGFFVESETQTVDLEADPVIFALLVNWIYTQTIKFGNGYHPVSASLVHLWVLADYLQMPKLQNQVIDLYHELSITQDNMGPSEGTGWSVRHVYESTTENSPLRRLLILHFAIFAEKKGLEERKIKKMFPQELFRDIAVCMAGFKADFESGFSFEDVWKYLDLEEYHVDEKPRR